jgi:hypothetical protein
MAQDWIGDRDQIRIDDCIDDVDRRLNRHWDAEKVGLLTMAKTKVGSLINRP